MSQLEVKFWLLTQTRNQVLRVDEFSESKEELEASAQEDEPQAATSGEGPTTWGLPQGRNIKIHLFVGVQMA